MRCPPRVRACKEPRSRAIVVEQSLMCGVYACERCCFVLAERVCRRLRCSLEYQRACRASRYSLCSQSQQPSNSWKNIRVPHLEDFQNQRQQREKDLQRSKSTVTTRKRPIDHDQICSLTKRALALRSKVDVWRGAPT